LARQQPYFANTPFLIVADHDTRVFGADLVPIEKLHIPGLILGPGVPVGRFDRLASQVDLLPTLLDLMGLDSEHPMIGRNLLQLAGDEPGHTFMQYDTTNAYRVGDRVVIHEPFKPPLEFTYRHGKLVRAPLDPGLRARCPCACPARRHALPRLRYRLPGESRSSQDAG